MFRGDVGTRHSGTHELYQDPLCCQPLRLLEDPGHVETPRHWLSNLPRTPPDARAHLLPSAVPRARTPCPAGRVCQAGVGTSSRTLSQTQQVETQEV